MGKIVIIFLYYDLISYVPVVGKGVGGVNGVSGCEVDGFTGSGVTSAVVSGCGSGVDAMSDKVMIFFQQL